MKMEPELSTTVKTGKVEKQFEILLGNSSNVLSTNHHTVQVLIQCHFLFLCTAEVAVISTSVFCFLASGGTSGL